MEVTIFTIPRAFEGIHERIQYNAVRSWLQLIPKPSVMLMCDDEGVYQAAESLGCMYVPDIKRNEYGTPFVDDAFSVAQSIVTTDVMCFVNTDIILMQDFIESLSIISRRFDKFLMAGRRWDLPYDTFIRLSLGWQRKLRETVSAKGTRHSVGSSDYFGFRRGLYRDIPPFAIGKCSWDNYLIGYGVNAGVDVVDATLNVTAVHQAAYSNPPAFRGSEVDTNRDNYFANRRGIVGTMDDAHWKLEEGELRKRG